MDDSGMRAFTIILHDRKTKKHIAARAFGIVVIVLLLTVVFLLDEEEPLPIIVVIFPVYKSLVLSVKIDSLLEKECECVLLCCQMDLNNFRRSAIFIIDDLSNSPLTDPLHHTMR